MLVHGKSKIITSTWLDLKYSFNCLAMPPFADWFTGEVIIKRGKLLRYVHVEFNSTYEIEIYIKIEKGLFIDKRVVDNRGKTFDPATFMRRRRLGS